MTLAIARTMVQRQQRTKNFFDQIVSSNERKTVRCPCVLLLLLLIFLHFLLVLSHCWLCRIQRHMKLTIVCHCYWSDYHAIDIVYYSSLEVRWILWRRTRPTLTISASEYPQRSSSHICECESHIVWYKFTAVRSLNHSLNAIKYYYEY